MQMIFQDPFASLNPQMKLQDHVAEPLINYGIGDAQELFRRSRGVWKPVFGTTRFLDSSGQLVAKEDLLAVGVSGDARWILSATDRGLGLYRSDTREWIAVSTDLVGEGFSQVDAGLVCQTH